MNEIHLTKKDFKLEWYSGQGAGGQHRNKHQNCCRITHPESGLTSIGTSSRSRVANQKEAFLKLAEKVIAYYHNDQGKERITEGETIRSYHAVRNEVHDKSSGLKLTYKNVVLDNNLGPMLEARKISLKKEE